MSYRRSPPPALHATVCRWLVWLADVQMRSPKTVTKYRSDAGQLTTFAVEHFATDDPRAMTADVLAAWISDMAPRLSPGTRIGRIGMLSSLFRWLRDTGQMPTNPAALLGRPSMPERLPRSLTVAEVERLLAEPTAGDLHRVRSCALLHVLYATGIRAAEVRGLKVSDLDLETGMARIIAKGNRERMVWVHERARGAVRRWLALRAVLIAERGWTDSGALFINFRDGRRFGAMRVWALVHEAGVEAGIASKVWTHRLRHSFAQHLLERGVELAVLQQLLGHHEISSTMVYLHVAPTKLVTALREHHPMA